MAASRHRSHHDHDLQGGGDANADDLEPQHSNMNQQQIVVYAAPSSKNHQELGSAAANSSPAVSQQDTTFTKLFVGGLAWETQKDSMRRHFQQYGEVIEAVVITDKTTGRSKGYGFVTFREPEAASRACADATPIIDGRRANCNLASLRSRANNLNAFTTYSNLMHGGNRFRLSYNNAGAATYSPGGVGQAVMCMGSPALIPTAPQHVQGTYPYHHGFPLYQIYGYPYSQELAYQQAVYSFLGGPHHLYQQQMYAGPTALSPNSNIHMYPYNSNSMQYSQGPPSASQAAGFSMQLPQQVMQYGSAAPQQYGTVGPVSPVSSSGLLLGYNSASPPPATFQLPPQQPFSTSNHQGPAKPAEKA